MMTQQEIDEIKGRSNGYCFEQPAVSSGFWVGVRNVLLVEVAFIGLGYMAWRWLTQ